MLMLGLKLFSRDSSSNASSLIGSTRMTTMGTIAVTTISVSVAAIASALFFENARWWWLKNYRRALMQLHWEPAEHPTDRETHTHSHPHHKQHQHRHHRSHKDHCCCRHSHHHSRHNQHHQQKHSTNQVKLGTEAAAPRIESKKIAHKDSALSLTYLPVQENSPVTSDDEVETLVGVMDDVTIEDYQFSETTTVLVAKTDSNTHTTHVCCCSCTTTITTKDSEILLTRRQRLWEWRFKGAESLWRQRLFHSLRVVGRFVNPFVEWQDRNTADFWAYLTWQATRNCRNGVPKDSNLIEEALPVVAPNKELWAEFHKSGTPATATAATADDDEDDASNVLERPMKNGSLMTVTWFGQSTCLVQMDGINILTDPIFSSRTVGEWVGPKRIQRVPCQLEDLPKLDLILVSHNHYDHLDRSVAHALGNSVAWVVPLGLQKWFKAHGITNLIELDWWQEYIFQDKFKIVATPIQHWSGRHFFDVNQSLWSSFVVKGPSASFFHVGDTGYCSAFKEIGQKYGPITFSAIPIGSYEPRYFMRHQHIDPEEAVKIHEDVGSMHSLGVHWGTFMMSDEHFLEPPVEFDRVARERGLRKGEIVTTFLGETFEILGNGQGLKRGVPEEKYDSWLADIRHVVEH